VKEFYQSKSYSPLELGILQCLAAHCSENTHLPVTVGEVFNVVRETVRCSVKLFNSTCREFRKAGLICITSSRGHMDRLTLTAEGKIFLEIIEGEK